MELAYPQVAALAAVVREGGSGGPALSSRAMAAASRASALGFLLFCLTLAGACAHDLPGWKVARSEHFLVYTDQKPRVFEPVLDRLEDVYAGLTASLFSAEIPATEVFLLEPSEFESLLGPWGGLAFRHDRRTILVLQEGWEWAFLEKTVAHELAHAFIGATFRAPPIWFNEGLATFAESIRVQDKAVLFGSNKTSVASLAAAGRLVKTNDLFLAPFTDFHGDWEERHYATAWAVVHYIWLGENKQLRPRFDAFGAALSEEGGKTGGTLRAWARVFPEVPLTELDGRLLDHMNKSFGRGRDAVVGFKFERKDRAPTNLTPADMVYVEEIREALRERRRPGKL